MRLLPLLALVATVSAGEREEFLARLSKTLGQVKSVRADFTQTKQLAVFKRPVTAQGVLIFERPDRLRWEIRKPFRSILIVNGDKVAKFEWVDGQWRALKLGRAADAILIAIGRLRRWLTGKFDEKAYEISVEKKPKTRLILKPRDEALKKTIASLELFPTKDLKAMRKVIVRERTGDVTEIAFSGHRTGTKPPKGAFSPTAPAPLDGGDDE
jgi:outer membrane lipoprotein carrier protein